MKKRTLIFIISSIAVVLLTTSYWRSDQPADSIVEKKPSSADYFFKQVSLKNYDENGKLINQVDAKKVEHFLLDNVSVFEAPKIKTLGVKDSDWLIQAKQGKLTHQTNQLDLINKVELTQTDKADQAQNSWARIYGEQLSFNLEQNTATTDETVTISVMGTETFAKGMQANFKKEHIELGEQVHTIGKKNVVD
ncbi:LPS export ABC transporter periplasmic protein LptC [Aliikangiella coralliicola]|uniref:LPS export ABC transporter periplasmic protein LptC n=1 Tax=Aliikangiella coralliicola TaxID=2592383 RepID=A0A545UK03_9GAMM|nr:LPS export ABC transporter periplasmic protein LptC [Aliikangiella coralliicola]TQV89789.1 LPS export ABC transporter periplasmic protein LptC [Aliikangiella coralliicola]